MAILPLTLHNCEIYAEKKLLDKHVSSDGSMIGFKYSRDTTYGQKWDEITLQCRGIVFDAKTGKILAHPFDKFFNIEEVFDADSQLTMLGLILKKFDQDPKISNTGRYMDKIDGSLGILFYTGKEWTIKTGGSFDSYQAVWAKRWADKNIDYTKLTKGYTYCFEIVMNGDYHVCKYDFEGLVLLGYFDPNHVESNMDQIRELAESLKIRYSKDIKFNTFAEGFEYAKNLDQNHEGFVVTFDNGFKVKIKSFEYLERFHQVSDISKKSIREHFDVEAGRVDPDYAASIPEELTDMRRYVNDLNTEFEQYTIRIHQIAGRIKNLTGLERYNTANTYDKNLASLAIDICNNKKIGKRLFQKVVDQLKKQIYKEFSENDI